MSPYGRAHKTPFTKIFLVWEQYDVGMMDNSQQPDLTSLSLSP